MAVSIADLKKSGVYAGAYKGIFSAPLAKKEPRIRKLEETITNRIRDTRNANFADYRTYLAIDMSHEAHFSATAPMMIQAIAQRNMSADDVHTQLGSWGLSERELFMDVDVPGVGTKKVLNYPVLFEVLLPVVVAYHTIRLAGIFGERDTSPCFKFVPLQQTDKNRVACNIWEDLVDTIATWYGYSAYKKQAISQMLKYGTMLSFPLEEWDCQYQIKDGVRKVEKEGLRYVMPHPTRMGYDLYHPLPTINTDTGCEWALHWSVVPYGSVLDSRRYWNKQSIMHASTNWFDPKFSYNYFQEVYPCTMRFPKVDAGGMKREDKAAFYGATNRDNAVFLTTKFWKLIPKDWGLGDYRYPVWHRFDVANDDTIVWAAPCAYNPIWFLGYDYDSAAGQHSSLSLEALQWQYHLTNILTQMVLTAKQNLVNLIYYDRNLIDPARIKEIENLGEKRYRGFHFIDFDGLQLAKAAGLDARNAFHQVQFQPRSIQELQSMIGTALSLMERMLQFTAQETGSAASHYQSRGEVEITKSSGDVRRNFTASGVDDGFDAWRLQVVTALKAYGNNDIQAQVSSDIKDFEKHVKALGFEVKDVGDRKVLVAGKKSSLPLEAFVRSNVGPQQQSDVQTGQAIMAGLTVAFQNETVFAAIGAKRIVRLMEETVKLMGGPRSFDITSDQDAMDDAPAMLEKLKPAFEALQASMMETIGEKIVKPIAEETAKEHQRLDSLEAVSKQLLQQWKADGAEAARLQMEQAKTAQEMQQSAAEFQSEQQRKQEKHTLDIQIATQRASLDSSLKLEKTQADNAIAASRAGVDAQTKLQKTESDLQIQEQSAAVDATNKTILTKAKAKAAASVKKPPAKP